MATLRSLRLSRVKRDSTLSDSPLAVEGDRPDQTPPVARSMSSEVKGKNLVTPRSVQTRNDPEFEPKKVACIQMAHYILVTLQDLQLEPGEVHIFIDTIHILPTGEIAFEFDIFAYVHRWKLVRMDHQILEFHEQMTTLNKAQFVAEASNSEASSTHEKIPSFLKKWIKSKDGIKTMALCKASPQGSVSLPPEKFQPIEELKKSGQLYFETVLKRFPAIVTNPSIKLFLDPTHDPSTWFLARNSKLRGTLEVNTVPGRYCVLFAGRIYVYATLEEKLPLFSVDLLCSKVEQLNDDAGNPTNAFEVIGKDVNGETLRTVFSCKVIHHVTEWVRSCRKARNLRPTKIQNENDEIFDQLKDVTNPTEIENSITTTRPTQNYMLRVDDAMFQKIYFEETENIRNVIYNQQGDRISFATIDQILDKVIFQNYDRKIFIFTFSLWITANELFVHFLNRLLYHSQDISGGSFPIFATPERDRALPRTSNALSRTSTVSGSPGKTMPRIATPPAQRHVTPISTPPTGQLSSSASGSKPLPRIAHKIERSATTTASSPPAAVVPLGQLLDSFLLTTPTPALTQTPHPVTTDSIAEKTARDRNSLGEVLTHFLPISAPVAVQQPHSSSRSPSQSQSNSQSTTPGKMPGTVQNSTETHLDSLLDSFFNDSPRGGDDYATARSRSKSSETSSISSQSASDAPMKLPSLPALPQLPSKPPFDVSSLIFEKPPASATQTAPTRSRKTVHGSYTVDSESAKPPMDFASIIATAPRHSPASSSGSSPSKSSPRRTKSKRSQSYVPVGDQYKTSKSSSSSPVSSDGNTPIRRSSSGKRSNPSTPVDIPPKKSTKPKSPRSISLPTEGKVINSSPEPKSGASSPRSVSTGSLWANTSASSVPPSVKSERKSHCGSEKNLQTKDKEKANPPRFHSEKNLHSNETFDAASQGIEITPAEDSPSTPVTPKKSKSAGTTPTKESKTINREKSKERRPSPRTKLNVVSHSDSTSSEPTRPKASRSNSGGSNSSNVSRTESVPSPQPNSLSPLTTISPRSDSPIPGSPIGLRTQKGLVDPLADLLNNPGISNDPNLRILACSKFEQVLEFLAWWSNLQESCFRKPRFIISSRDYIKTLGIEVSPLENTQDTVRWDKEDQELPTQFHSPLPLPMEALRLDPKVVDSIHNSASAQTLGLTVVPSPMPNSNRNSHSTPNTDSPYSPNTVTQLSGGYLTMTAQPKNQNMIQFFPELIQKYASITKNQAVEFIWKDFRADTKVESSSQAPLVYKPVLPTVFQVDSIQIFDISAKELAKQLAIISLALMRNIQPPELLHWNAQKEHAKNLAIAVENFNSLTQWAKTLIVTGCSVQQRAFYITKIIAIMYHSIGFNNYHIVTAFKTALNQIAISRLKKSWALVSQKAMSRFTQIEKIMDPDCNWKNYRDKMNASKVPFIPYIGLLISDLLFINDGNPTYKIVDDVKLVNWEKCVLMGAIIRRFIASSDYSYPFVYLPEVETVFNESLKNRIDSDKEIYKMSVALEAKSVKPSRA